jgi:hypothetical protein
MATSKNYTERYGGGRHPKFTFRYDDARLHDKLMSLVSYFEQVEGSKVSSAEVIRRCIDLAHRNCIMRHTLEAPEPPKPRCKRCGQELGYWHECGKPEPRERTQKSIQLEMEARQRFERLGMLPMSKD